MNRRFWTDLLLLAIAAGLVAFCLQSVNFTDAAYRANWIFAHYWALLAAGIVLLVACSFTLRLPLR